MDVFPSFCGMQGAGVHVAVMVGVALPVGEAVALGDLVAVRLNVGDTVGL
jgi:hypothetical protein